jgi:hypothetical protein
VRRRCHQRYMQRLRDGLSHVDLRQRHAALHLGAIPVCGSHSGEGGGVGERG